MKRKMFLLFLILFLSLPSYALIQIPDKQDRFILFDINADGKKEVIAEQNKGITVYQVKSNQCIELSKINSLGTIEDFLATDKELYILMNRILYQCQYMNHQLSLIKIRDLSLEMDYMFSIFRDSDNILNIIGIKTLKSSEEAINLVKLMDKKMITFQLQVFPGIYSMQVLHENNETKILIVDGVQESTKGITVYKIANNQLEMVQKINIPKYTFTTANFFTKGNSLYVTAWFGDVDTDDAFPGIFKFDLATGKAVPIIKLKDDVFWMDIGDVDGDGKDDLIWTDGKKLNVETDWNPIQSKD